MMDSIDHGVKDDDYDNISNYAPNLDDAIDSEYAERTAYIKKISLENAELKAYHTISEGLFIKIDALKDVLKEAKEFAKGIRVFLITNNMGHIDTDKLIDDINKAIGDKE